MLVLGLQGSPRKKGNTSFLLNSFMEKARETGANTRVIEVCKKNIIPCKEYCPIDDDMKTEIYYLLRKAEVIVVATPIFFYNTPAQLKALIDRSQTLWARKYKLSLTDPKRNYRRGYVLAVGATKGKNLFEGLHLTMKYFFDAVAAEHHGSLTYRRIENPGDMKNHPSVAEDIEKGVEDLLRPLVNRKRYLFLCRENACRSQMATAFAQRLAGERIEAVSGGSEPAQSVNATMIESMEKKGIDMDFIKPQSIDEAMEEGAPDVIVTMGCGEACPFVPGAKRLDWDLPDPAQKGIEFMDNVRDEIENRVKDLLAETS
jgi:multimeric flavodoxin WrbA/protein-tyrosine-phosphatase